MCNKDMFVRCMVEISMTTGLLEQIHKPKCQCAKYAKQSLRAYPSVCEIPGLCSLCRITFHELPGRRTEP